MLQRNDDSALLASWHTKYKKHNTCPNTDIGGRLGRHVHRVPTLMTGVFPLLNLHPLDLNTGLRRLAADAIRKAIAEMDIYGDAAELRLDERRLGQELGVSRTPIREALSHLEQEGLVRTIPRRGVFVVRKSKAEVVEMVTVWAALESLAARRAADNAPDADLAALRALFDGHQSDPAAHLHEYSQANMAFHRAILRMGGVALMSEIADTLFIHMRAVRAVTMGQDNRAQRGMAEHMAIIDALERRDPGLAERLVREHTLGLAAHIETHGGVLDALPPPETR